MAIQELLDRLEERARAEGESILEEARREAERIRTEADERLERQREERLSRKERTLRDAAAVRIAELRRESEREVLEAREDFLEAVFRGAAGRLDGAEGEEWFRRELEEALDRALAHLGPGSVTVQCRPELADPVRDALSAAGREGEVREEASAEAGLVVREADGYPLVRDTYLERLRRRRDELAIRVVAAVEGKEA